MPDEPSIVRPAGESTTEYLLTSPDAYGIETASPAQRAICRILDGVPLGELAHHPDVLALVGGEDALGRLPCQHGEHALELVLLAAIRCAKTIVACAAAIRMSQTVDVSRLGDGETARVPLLSVNLKQAGVAMKFIRDAIMKPKLRHLLIGEPTKESLWLRHPSGRAIEITVTAGAKAGGNLVSVWLAGVVFDEAPRMNGADDGVVNLSDARAAVLGRLLPGAQALYIGSPWAPFGPVYDMVQKGFGSPSDRCIVLRGTGPMLNPALWTPDACDALRESNEVSYQTDVLGEFVTADGSLIGVLDAKRSTREAEGDLPRVVGAQYFASMDPSDGTEQGNPWTLVITERTTVQQASLSPEGVPVLTSTGKPVMHQCNRFRTAAVREWRGVRPKDVIADAARACAAYGLRHATTDQYAGSALVDIASEIGFTLVVVPWTSARKVQAYTNVATLVKEGLLELHPDKQFQRDLLSVRKRPVQNGGYQIVLPRMGDGRHCDYAPALAGAVEAGNQAPMQLSSLPPVGTASRWSGMSGRGFG